MPLCQGKESERAIFCENSSKERFFGANAPKNMPIGIDKPKKGGIIEKYPLYEYKLRNGVMVAPQSLNLLVGVRVPIPQPKIATAESGCYFFGCNEAHLSVHEK